jgi:hypothetical protein
VAALSVPGTDAKPRYIGGRRIGSRGVPRSFIFANTIQ